MELLWILLIVVVALALFGGLGARGGWGRGAGTVDGGPRAGFGGGVLGLIVVVLLVILLVSLLT